MTAKSGKTITSSLPPQRGSLCRTVVALMLREMATSYGRSPGGYVWAVLEPVAAIALFSVVLSLALHSPSLGRSFPLFYATGYLPFMLFFDLAGKTALSIRFSRPLLAYPRVNFVDAILARFVLNMLTHLVVFCAVLSGIFMFSETSAVLDLPRILHALAMAGGLAIGVGVTNCFLMSFYPIWERIWQILTRPLFLVSGIFFLYEDLPGQAQDVMWFNPLLHILGEMRRGFYPVYDGTYISPSYVWAISLIGFGFGLMLLRRHILVILND